MFFFDLDGPILDVSERYYRLYADILRKCGQNYLIKPNYWNLKRQKISEKKILEYTGASFFFDFYARERKKLIESNDYLCYDQLQPSVGSTLDALSNSHELVLVTLRSSSDQLNKQLEFLDIKKYFSFIFSSAKNGKDGWDVKLEIIKNFMSCHPVQEIPFIAGDTEADIVCGNKLNFKTIAVLNGIRTKECLEEYNPTFFVESVEGILKLNSET
jgi:phosphoglycolate phosphatase-like HAD superfamily hydrolase